MVLAGLVAEGETQIGYIHHIDRGYDNLVKKLCATGADIRRNGEANNRHTGGCGNEKTGASFWGSVPVFMSRNLFHKKYRSSWYNKNIC